jgi:hypothetical protein
MPVDIPSNRPGKNEPWPAAHGRLTIILQPSDIILFEQLMKNVSFQV